MHAYKRLQKPDVIFGHSDRTAKVAFAEPLPEPDPAVMALVNSVFVDGLPPHWDEDRVRKEFKCYGDLDRITLARNMSNAKRKDFGFVDFTTHEAAVACIDDINTRGLGDGKSKVFLVVVVVIMFFLHLCDFVRLPTKYSFRGYNEFIW